ncbi:MAG TPA: site-2 protease family protein [Methylomirabilota bacterium]|nr:site-2 protease family protein [Methylomirabilota bacterium]
MNAVPIARLFGFEIRVHVSWAIILAVIGVTAATQVAELAPEVGGPASWLVGGVVAAAFLLSALAHELGHAIAARRAGLPGGPVIVYFFGGAASSRLETSRPRDEIVIALAGPLVSLATGAVFTGVGLVGELAGGWAQGAGRVALAVGALNLLLGGVNLLPAFPLDGGRIVRGLAWARTGDAKHALRIAASAGRYLGILFATLGIVGILVVDSLDGLMLAVCGWFIVSSASAVERTAEIDAMLEGISVGDVMDHDVSGVPPGLTLDTFADQVLDGASHAAVAVMRGPDLLGIVGEKQVRRVRRDRWAATRAEDLMVSGDALPRVGPEMSLRDALDRLHRSGLDGLPVVESGALTGIVTRRAVAKAVAEAARNRLRPGGAPAS